MCFHLVTMSLLWPRVNILTFLPTSCNTIPSSTVRIDVYFPFTGDCRYSPMSSHPLLVVFTRPLWYLPVVFPDETNGYLKSNYYITQVWLLYYYDIWYSNQETTRVQRILNIVLRLSRSFGLICSNKDFFGNQSEYMILSV